MNFKNILCPIDFSENMDKVLNLAIKLSEENATITLFHHSVLITPTAGPDAAVVFEADQERKEYSIQHLDDLAAKLKSKYPTRKFTTMHTYLKDITDEVNDIVKSEDIDLIVMGTHGRTGLSRIFAGSVAEDILRHVNCPVFMMKF